MKWCPVLVPVLTQQPGTWDGTISDLEFSKTDINLGRTTLHLKSGCLSTKIFFDRRNKGSLIKNI